MLLEEAVILGKQSVVYHCWAKTKVRGKDDEIKGYTVAEGR